MEQARVTRGASAKASAASAALVRGRFFSELPEELVVHIVRQLKGHILFAAAVSSRLHGIVMQQMLKLPFLLDPDDPAFTQTLRGLLAVKHWSKLTSAPTKLCAHVELVNRDGLVMNPLDVLRRKICPPTGFPNFQGWQGYAGWSFLNSTRRLAPGSCLTFSLRVGQCLGRETKIELAGGVILRSSETVNYEPEKDIWSYQMWNVPGGGFTLKAPSRVNAHSGWHRFAQIVNDDGSVEMYEDGRYCFTAQPRPDLQIKFDVFNLDSQPMKVDLTDIRYFNIPQDAEPAIVQEDDEGDEGDEGDDDDTSAVGPGSKLTGRHS